MAVLVVIAFHVLVKWAFLSGQSLKAGSPVALMPILFDVLFILPFAFLGQMGLYTSIYALVIFILYSWLLQFGMFVGVQKTSFVHDFKCTCPRLVYAVSALNVIYLIGVFSNIDVSQLSFSAESLGMVANRNSVARYAGVLDISLSYKIGVIAAFASSVAGGVLFSVTNSKKISSIAALVLLIGLIDSITMGARAGYMMMMITFFASSYAIRLKISNPRNTYSYFGLAKRGLVSIVLVVLFFFSIQVLRGGGDFTNSVDIFNYVLTWFFGYLPAFSLWIDNYAGQHPLSFGQYTFAGIVNLTGIAERVGGVYSLASIGDLRYSNVFTAFRGLITDFGIIGSMLFILVISISLGKGLKKGLNNFWIAYGSSVIIMSFLGWSFVVSIWTYNSVVFGQLVGLLICSRLLKITRW